VHAGPDEAVIPRTRPGRSCDHAEVTDRVLYRSLMSDNLRWDALRPREGDIVISAPSKCGMTWTQRLVSLLVFGGPDLPGPMSAISPWLDQTIHPIGEVVGTLDAQRHRRFIKTHTPLDGLILDNRVTYICVGRDPRDAAVSMMFHEANMDPSRMRALHDAAAPAHDRFAPPPDTSGELDPRAVFRDWMERPIMPPEGMSSLATLFHHYNSFWQRKHIPNVAVFHYADYQVDLVGELVRLGQVLGYNLDRLRAEELAHHATLGAMRDRASEFAPNAVDGLWRSDERFFRSGSRGEWQQVFTEQEHRRYLHRVDQLGPRNLLAWAHDGRRGYDPAA
jgi:Sulfotransferase domain